MTDEEREAQRQKDLAALQTWGEQLTAGLKGNRDTILNEKAKLQEQYDAIQAKWGDLDPERVKDVMARLDNDEELKLVEEGKLDEVIARRTEQMRRDFEVRLEAATGKIAELETSMGGRGEIIKRLTIDSKIREVGLGMETPIHAKAMGDAIRAGRDLFTLGEDDAVVALQEDGSPVIGKDGTSPLGIEEWLGTKFAEGTTLWWGSSSGGGATGGGEGGGKGPNADDVEKMSARDKLKVGVAAQA